MLDTIKVIHDTIYVKGADTLDILTKINEFYNSAWDKLILVLTASFAVLGVLVPIGIQWYQRRSLKIDKQELETSITTLFKKEILEETTKVKEQFDKVIAQEVEKLNSKSGKLETRTVSIGLFVQGNADRKFKQFELALVSYITAIKGLASCGDWYNFDRIVNAMEITLPNVRVARFAQLGEKNVSTFFKNMAEVRELCTDERKAAVDKLVNMFNDKQATTNAVQQE